MNQQLAVFFEIVRIRNYPKKFIKAVLFMFLLLGLFLSALRFMDHLVVEIPFKFFDIVGYI